MADTSDVVIRQARHTDYEAVMEINRDVYAGFDYLYSMYHPLLHDPSKLAVVAEADGKVIGFAGRESINNGTASNGIAARVNSAYQKRGIPALMYNLGRTRLLDKYSGTTGSVYTAFLTDFHRNFVRENYVKMVLEWNVMAFKLQKSDLPPVNQDTTRYNTKELKASEAMSLFENQQLCKALFPTGWFVSANYWGPSISSFEALSSAVKKQPVIATFNEQEEVVGLSFSPVCKVQDGIRLDIWFYGNNQEALREQVLFVLQKQCAVLQAKLNLMLHFPIDFGADSLYEQLKPSLGEKFTDAPFDSLPLTAGCFYREIVPA